MTTLAEYLGWTERSSDRPVVWNTPLGPVFAEYGWHIPEAEIVRALIDKENKAGMIVVGLDTPAQGEVEGCEACFLEPHEMHDG